MSSNDKRGATQLESLLRIVEPVREELHGVESELADLDAAKAEYLAEYEEKKRGLMEKVRAARGVIRLVDPNDPDVVAVKKKSNGKRGARISVENVERMRQWLTAQMPEGEFAVMTVHDHPDFDLGFGRDTVRFALESLQDAGVVRLDRLGYIGPGPHRGRRYNVYALNS